MRNAFSVAESISVTGIGARKQSLIYKFTSVFSPEATQEDVYTDVAQDVVQVRCHGKGSKHGG